MTRRLPIVFSVSLCFLLVPRARALADPREESCFVCHAAFGESDLGLPAQRYPEDIHFARGFGCVACHGGDGTDPELTAMDPEKGYAGKPAGEEIVRVCGRCHSDARFMHRYNPSLRVDQVTEYYTSVHGRKLREGDLRVATCTSCHGVHEIRPPSDPRSTVHPLRVADTCGSCHADPELMGSYGLPADPVERYKRSVHWMRLEGGDLSSPTCNDCHGNHGAAPPGVSWVGNVCGQCHAQNAELFARSFHAEIFTRMGIPGCASCHGNHDIVKTSDRMLGLDDPAVCAACHSAEDAGGKAALAMREAIDTLARRYDEARVLLERATRAGMPTGPVKFRLTEAHTALVKARAAVHAFDVSKVRAEVDPGLEIADEVRTQAQELLAELQFRRKGLAVSLVVILAVLVGLVLKIREIERRR
ncbi:MAG: hypothetical protein KatS3mg076_0060 [Candidatus Binatia bacterium]|nr:MAG: hypothetical protein KatS3mg076_0060 [Candidatus Binatia bacterium]